MNGHIPQEYGMLISSISKLFSVFVVGSSRCFFVVFFSHAYQWKWVISNKLASVLKTVNLNCFCKTLFCFPSRWNGIVNLWQLPHHGRVGLWLHGSTDCHRSKLSGSKLSWHIQALELQEEADMQANTHTVECTEEVDCIDRIHQQHKVWCAYSPWMLLSWLVMLGVILLETQSYIDVWNQYFFYISITKLSKSLLVYGLLWLIRFWSLSKILFFLYLPHSKCLSL